MPATILLVDADLIDRADWQALLQFHGYRVFTVGNGKAALEECSRIQPDLVLLDVGLQDMPGFELFRRLKEDPRNVQTPIVLMGPYSYTGHPKSGQEIAAKDSWDQPTSRSEALQRVQSILKSKTLISDQAQSVVFALARTIEARDVCTDGHSGRLSIYAMKLGENLGLPFEEIEALRIGGLVHDIGKVAVPDSILLKPGPLNSKEKKIMEQHPVVGERICAPLKSLRRVLPIIRHHHERLDGSGYPDGLKGENVPVNARILNLVDIFDSLTTDRPYRKALPVLRALKIIGEEADRGWRDRFLIERFTHILPEVQRLNPATA